MSDPCQLCGFATTPRFTVPCDYRRPSPAASYEVRWCVSCEFGQVSPRPTASEVADFYRIGDYYTHHSPTSEARGDGIGPLARLRLGLAWRFDRGVDPGLDELTPLLRPGANSICDIGCGSGGLLDLFRRGGFSNAIGVEPDPDARRVAIESQGLSVHDGTAEELPPAIVAGSFDVVCMSHVLEHCLDVNVAVRNAVGLLRPDGVILIEVPNNAARAFSTQAGEWPWADVPRHLNFFCRRSLEAVLRRHGMEPRLVTYRGFTRQFSPEWVASELRIRRAFANAEGRPDPGPRPVVQKWLDLVRGAFAAPERKYDSIRVVAARAGGAAGPATP